MLSGRVGQFVDHPAISMLIRFYVESVLGFEHPCNSGERDDAKTAMACGAVHFLFFPACDGTGTAAGQTRCANV